jgi:mono/diheme cytochrome c family protein
MKKSWVSFITLFLLSFVVSFGIVYFIVDGGKTNESIASTDASNSNKPSEQEKSGGEEQLTKVDAEAEIFESRGCIQCHAVDAYNIDGGKVGPDLSNAFNTVPEKHGKQLDEFLKDPTTAVMQSVISSDPLTDEEREKVVKALQKISVESKGE